MIGTIEERVIKIISEELRLSPEKVIPTANLENDLHADSLDRIDIIMALETEFNCDISEEDAQKILTVQDAIDWLNFKETYQKK